jgi:hypothetical protein
MESPLGAARGFGIGRAVFGAVMVAAPDLVTRRWVGRDGATPGGRVLARGLAARDLGIGLGTALAPAGAKRHWLLAGVLADAADAAAAGLASDIPRLGRFGTLAFAAGGAAYGVGLLVALD